MAGHSEFQPAPQCKTVDGGEVGLAGLRNPVKEQIMASLSQCLAFGGAKRGKLCNVCAGHKTLGARSGDNHHPQVVAGIKGLHMLVQLLNDRSV